MIRIATKDDITGMADLWKEWVLKLSPCSEPNKEMWIKSINALIDLPDIYCAFVLEENNEIVGFIDAIISVNPVTNKLQGIGQHFYVSSKVRNKHKVGTLYREFISLGLWMGITEFSFLVDKTELKFWERHGYKIKSFLVSREV